ncbi:MAG: shikimate kinase [Arcobacter sp.]|nr:MAG: shikimate kinase [Arcobacter sp.]
MGVGKGTIARTMVKQSDYFAIDTDDLIESLENKKIKKIFEENGELYFRNLEKKCALWCEKNITNSIISTGGGFYKQENIKKIGTIIYLQSSFDKILEGIRNSPNAKKKLKKRPLLNDLDEAKKIYEQRIIEYEKVANIVINIEELDPSSVAKKILQTLFLE